MTPRRLSSGRRPWGGVRLLVALGLVGACLVASLVPAPFLLDRRAVADGEVWRWVTGHLVHASRAHFLFDVGVGVVLLLVVRWRRSLWLLPPFVGTLVLALRPDLDVYTGLSGVLHGWTVLATVDVARGGDRLEQGLAFGVLLGVLIKALVESALGTSIFTERFDMGGPTVYLAHLTGVLGGLLIAGAEVCRAPGGHFTAVGARRRFPCPPLGTLGGRHTVKP